MTTQQAIDFAKVQAFMGKVMGDNASAAVTVMASIGDRLGLFKALAKAPATSSELAERAHINERYAREWLSEMTSAGYLQHDPESRRFTLPPEHVPVLAQEGGPFFLGGAFQLLMGEIGAYNRLLSAFQQGGGVPMEAYDPATWDGMERFSAGMYEHLLVPMYLAAMPEVQAKIAGIISSFSERRRQEKEEQEAYDNTIDHCVFVQGRCRTNRQEKGADGLVRVRPQPYLL
jgi:hypothetical protein